MYSPDRVLFPLKRVGRKGEGRFERVSWDEALDTIAARFRAVIASHGPQAIVPYSYAGNMGLLSYGSMDRRFFGALGASLLERTICASAGAAGLAATVGKSIGFDPEAVVHARLIVAWGANIVSSNVHLWPFIEEARLRGAKLVVVDPYRSRTAEQRRPAPRTAAGDGRRAGAGDDARGLPRRARGPRLHRALHRGRRTPSARGRRSGRRRAPRRSPASTRPTIEAFAREYATRQPSAIRLNYGLNRHAGGGTAVRVIAGLPAIVGAWRHVGGGVLLSTSGTFPTATAALERPDLVPPGTRSLNMSQIGRLLNDASLAPPIQALFVYNSNPVAVAPEQESVRAGFAREDLFTVVHDLFLTDTADFADIVLPATTTLEHYDIHKAYGHLYLSLSKPAIEPLGESKPNTEVFRLLAARMGLDHPALRESDEQMARAAMDWSHPHLRGVDFDRLEREGVGPPVRARRPSRPSRRGTSRTRVGEVPACYADYVPPRENVDSNPELARRYPLAFISPPAHHFLNSTFSAQPIFVRRESEPTLTIHPADAAARGIRDGQQVRTFNDRGSFLAAARVSDDARPGVVVGLSIWWAKMCPGGRNANAVTGQELTDLGGGATFYDVLVDVAPA